MENRAGIYVHIPFCARKCGYCDFNVYVTRRAETKADYVAALCREIRAFAEPALSVPTIFFGGGTPTQLAPDDLARILRAVRQSFSVADDAEITLEANPDDATPELFSRLRAIGFNRLSLGVQTFDDNLLRTIERQHSARQAEQAVQWAKNAGFENLSLDLIFGLPRQTLDDWKRSLDRAVSLDVSHLSVYALIVEEKTAFWARQKRGELALPGDDTETEMFDHARRHLFAQGYRHYEISNYARPGFACRHNIIYWRNEPYLGFGAGAFGYRNGVRSQNARRLKDYGERIAAMGSATIWNEHLSAEAAMGETMMVHLRLTDGVNLDEFARRFSVRAEQHWQSAIEKWTKRGLIEIVDGYLRLTEPGLFLSNDVLADFLSAPQG